MNTLRRPHGLPATGRKRVRIDRVFNAPRADVREMWTTPAGVESWWGPEGFKVSVSKMDLRVGGTLLYSMKAVGADQVAFMKSAGMPVEQHLTITFREVVPQVRLSYDHDVDFVSDVQAYSVLTTVELEDTPRGTLLSLTLDAMHEDTWTQRAVEGWKQELGKLDAVMQRRSP